MRRGLNCGKFSEVFQNVERSRTRSGHYSYLRRANTDASESRAVESPWGSNNGVCVKYVYGVGSRQQRDTVGDSIGPSPRRRRVAVARTPRVDRRVLASTIQTHYRVA
jgi:hypothetical protein